jgi:hypothetical protein
MKDWTKRLTPPTLTVLVAAAALVGPAAAQRPDDRAGPLGVGAASNLAASAERPDNRGGLLGVGSVANANAAESAVHVRPDDRDGIRGPVLGGTPVTSVTITSDHFAWRDAFLGAGTTLGLIVLAGLLALTIRARRVITP